MASPEVYAQRPSRCLAFSLVPFSHRSGPVLVRPAAHRPTEVPLGPAEGLPKACVVNLDTITTIPRRTLTRPIGPLPAEKLAAVERALIFALGLGRRPA